MGARRELLAPFMHVDFLVAELEREALLGRCLKGGELHAEHFSVEADARCLVARGENDVVDVVDHTILSFLSWSISRAENFNSRSTSSVCSPSLGAALRILPGVDESLGTMPGTLSGSPSPAVTVSLMPPARKGGGAAVAGGRRV